MARYSIEGQILTDMADAIREKAGVKTEIVNTVIASTPGAKSDGSIFNDGSGNYQTDTNYLNVVSIPEAKLLEVNIISNYSISYHQAVYIIPGVWDGVGDIPDNSILMPENRNEYMRVFENTNVLTFVYHTGTIANISNYGYYATIIGKTFDGMNPEEMVEGIKNISAGSNELAEAIVNRTITEYSNSELLKLNDYVFYGCQSLTSIDCPKLKTIGDYALSKTVLTQVDFPLVTSVGENAFEAASASAGTLISVNLPAATSIGAYAFRYQLLESITLPALTSIGGYRVFEQCKSLVRVDFGPLKSVGNYCFNSCSKLETLILRNTAMTTLGNTNAFSGTKIASGTGYIYVPSALLDSYKTATNWTTYAEQFRAIEDYPDICG